MEPGFQALTGMTKKLATMKHIRTVLEGVFKRYAKTYDDLEEYRAALQTHAAQLPTQLRGIAAQLTPLSFKNGTLTLSVPRVALHPAEAHFYAEHLRQFFVSHAKRDIRSVRIVVGEG